MSSPTPLIAAIPGDPDQVRRISAQLATVEARAREIESRLRAIETGVGPQMWRGQAADGFAALLAGTGPDLIRLASSYGAASQALATYATELAAAQDAARAAEAEGTSASSDRDRATAERDSARSDALQHAAAADDARLRMDPVAAQDAEQRRTDALGRETAAGTAIDEAEQALRAAQQKGDQAAERREAAVARCIRDLDQASGAPIAARAITQSLTPAGEPRTAAQAESLALGGIGSGLVGFGQNLVSDVWEKIYFNAGDFANGVAGGLYSAHRRVLQGQAEWNLEEARRLRQDYLNSPGGSEAARRFTELELAAANRAAELGRRVDKLGGFRGSVMVGKVPIVGSLITAGGIWYDIKNGKPAGKAIISGAAGFGAGIVAGMLIGGPVGWAALGGVAASAVIGAGVDMAYDALPKGVQGTIENGVEAIRAGIAEGGRSVWDAIF